MFTSNKNKQATSIGACRADFAYNVISISISTLSTIYPYSYMFTVVYIFLI